MNRRRPGAPPQTSDCRSRPRRHPRALHLDPTAFEALVAEAVEALPPYFREHLRNVEVLVQDWPSAAQLQEVGLDAHGSLLGLYEGVPITTRADNEALLMPDMVTLFQGPLERHAGLDAASLREQVVHTLMHEIAHHFGISDERMLELGVY